MAAENEIDSHAMWEGAIGEMGSAATISPDLQVPIDFMSTVTANDDDPMFVTVEVESGWSKSRRNWKPEHLKKVVDKVNAHRMAGNLGHPLLDPKSHERDFPIPQVAWVVASMRESGGRSVAKFKGYVLKTAQARELLKLGLIDGVSIFGDSRMKPVKDGYEVISFEPETIDFARKGKSGMQSRILALTGEEEPLKGGWNVEPREIASLTVDEIKTHAPLVHKAIVDEALEPINVKVGEMETTISTMKPEVDVLGEIKKLLKLEDGENPVEKLANFITRVEETATSEIKAFVHELVTKKVKTERGQQLLRRLIGEMESTGFSFSSEYEGPLTDDLKKKITDDFTAKVDGDDEIKELVGEMVSSATDDRRGGSGGSALGGRSRVGEDHGRNEEGERRGGLLIKKKKLAEVS